MNKIIVVIGIFTIAFISFTVGYKYGDSNGYDAGYKEGYRYDCKEEIGTLYNRVKHLSTAVSFTDSVMQRIIHENDSLKKIKHFYDSISVRQSFSSDSLKYAHKALILNDSLQKAIGFTWSNFIQADGRANVVLCLTDDRLKKLPQCKPGWRIK